MINPDEMLQKVASHQGQYCMPFVQQCFDTASDSKLYLFKFWNKYGKELMCQNT